MLKRVHREKTGWIYAWNPINNLKNEDWLNFGLILNGEPIGRNAELCPFTSDVLSSLPIPVVVGGFSLMRPHSVISKHTDINTPTTRSIHLGLDVPGTDDCMLTIHEGAQIRHEVEKNGRAFWFDARNPHWAVNMTAFDRIVLYLDVETNK